MRIPAYCRFLLCGALWLLGAGLPPAGAGAPDTNAPAALRPGDALLVRIDHLGGGLPAYREIVDSDGNIELPFLPYIAAAGKAIPDLAAEMAAAYARAKLSSNAVVHLDYITHFEPPPARAHLVRIEDPRQPAAAGAALAPAP